MIRNATVLVLAAALALNAPAANLEIPQKYLDQEARTRAALTSAEQARVSALVARLSPKMSIQDVRTMAAGDSAGTLFVVMMEYLKMVLKEARGDAKIQRSQAELALAEKEGKLAQEKGKIDAQKREAEERFNNAMASANLEMLMGMASGLASVGSAGLVAGGPTGNGTANAPVGAARLAVTPVPVKGVSTPTKTPTRTPAPGK